MARNGTAPPSRAGKRQVTCYVDPPLLAATKARAATRRQPLQQVLAEAINVEVVRRGLMPAITCHVHHVFVRLDKAAKPRVRDYPCRLGRTVIAGWYDRIEVDRLRRFSCEIGFSVQDIAHAGLLALQGSEPATEAGELVGEQTEEPVEEAA